MSRKRMEPELPRAGGRHNPNGETVSNAKPLSYADRAERYLRQRGIPHDPSRMSIHKLTAPQRRRAIRKEHRGWRKLAEASRA